jgi:hypothetical protein
VGAEWVLSNVESRFLREFDFVSAFDKGGFDCFLSLSSFAIKTRL